LSGLVESFQNLRTCDLAKASGDTLKALYGGSDDMVLFWAHHEKLCLIDGHIAFMGGLDMCTSWDELYVDFANRRLGFGRYDTNSTCLGYETELQLTIQATPLRTLIPGISMISSSPAKTTTMPASLTLRMSKSGRTTSVGLATRNSAVAALMLPSRPHQELEDGLVRH
jgi:hypothetical protein